MGTEITFFVHLYFVDDVGIVKEYLSLFVVVVIVVVRRTVHCVSALSINGNPLSFQSLNGRGGGGARSLNYVFRGK